MSRSSESPTDEVIYALVVAGNYAPASSWINEPIRDQITDLVNAEAESVLDSQQWGEDFAEAVRVRNRRAAIIRDICRLADLTRALNEGVDYAKMDKIAELVRGFLPGGSS